MARTDTASRVVPAFPERVYAALIDLDALTTWLPPTGMTARFDRFDARPGGSYRMVLTDDDLTGTPGKTTAASDVVEARFVEPIPGGADRAGRGVRPQGPGLRRHHDHDPGTLPGRGRHQRGDPRRERPRRNFCRRSRRGARLVTGEPGRLSAARSRHRSDHVTTP
ncbi:SRPBCC domain-containing protein [Kocuria sediminis]|uniref:SRPBCC domain-containing protein n=1 Tax=Kocuria sediminis TaxID=1038857 RepID=UPI001F0DE046|nr:SRPBCC domain-containing protein [Kocuria sediminis]